MGDVMGESDDDGARRMLLCTSCRATLRAGEQCDLCPRAHVTPLDDEEALDGLIRQRPERPRSSLTTLVGMGILYLVMGGVAGTAVGGLAMVPVALFDFVYSIFTGHDAVGHERVFYVLFGGSALGAVVGLAKGVKAGLKPKKPTKLLPGAAPVRPSRELETFEGVVVSERAPAALGLLALRDAHVLASYGHVHTLIVRGDRGELAIAGRVRLLYGERERPVDADAFEQVLPCSVDVLEADALLGQTLEPGDRVRVYGSLHCEQLPTDYREEPEERWQLEGVPWLELLEVG